MMAQGEFVDRGTPRDVNEEAKSPGINVKQAEKYDYLDHERRTLALVKACETTREGDDDFAILARAGRFLNFLREGK